MKSIVIFLFSLNLVITAVTDFPSEDGVCILTKDNFDKAINEFQYTLVNFYTPYSSISKYLAPNFAKAAQRLSESNPEIKLCKVNGEAEPHFSNRFDFYGYPTLLFFTKGNPTPIECHGARTPAVIFKWVVRKLRGTTSEVKSLAEAQKMISENSIVAIFFGSPSSSTFEIYQKTAADEQYEDIVFLYSESEEVRQRCQGIENSLALVTGNGDDFVMFQGSLTPDSLEAFLQKNRFPLVMEYTLPVAGKIGDESLTALFLFVKNSEEGKNVSQVFKTAVSEYKGKDVGLVFSIISLEDELGERTAAYFEIGEDETPAVRIFQQEERERKYVLNGEITVENLRAFIQAYSEKKLKPFFKSEEIPDEPFEFSVRIVVGKDWKEVVLDSTKDVLIMYYPPMSMCRHCGRLYMTYFKLAGMLKENKDLVIAMMDITKNEVESVNIRKVPAFFFYPRNNKQNPVYFKADKETYEEFESFVRKHATVSVTVPETKKETPVDDDL